MKRYLDPDDARDFDIHDLGDYGEVEEALENADFEELADTGITGVEDSIRFDIEDQFLDMGMTPEAAQEASEKFTIYEGAGPRFVETDSSNYSYGQGWYEIEMDGPIELVEALEKRSLEGLDVPMREGFEKKATGGRVHA
ncbi:MAG: hypothetical protein GTO54_07015 [Nitrososphaeria archaeon]|nr:hypothetical protein [Nitrososphaeria archaeon]